MARVITFSTAFPKTHVFSGHPTYFVERIWRYNEMYRNQSPSPEYDEILKLEVKRYSAYNIPPKLHTIRAGNRWRAGEMFSPRIWSGKPYKSKQIIIAPDMVIRSVQSIEIDLTKGYKNIVIDGKYIDDKECDLLAANDGLSWDGFEDWFNKPFKGQIVNWSDHKY